MYGCAWPVWVYGERLWSDEVMVAMRLEQMIQPRVIGVLRMNEWCVGWSAVISSRSFRLTSRHGWLSTGIIVHSRRRTKIERKPTFNAILYSAHNWVRKIGWENILSYSQAQSWTGMCNWGDQFDVMTLRDTISITLNVHRGYFVS